MFKTSAIKNAKRISKNRLGDKTVAECAKFRPDERTMPYFDIVPEQVLADLSYKSLQPIHQGQFWRFIIHVAAIDRGLIVRHSGATASRLGIAITEWEELEAVLLDKGLLVVTENGNYLMQHEFREQYLQTLETNNAKRRKP